MYKLYYSAGSCAMAVHAVLEELKVPYTVQQVQIHGQKSPELLKVNPRGSVPVLEDDGTIIREGGAIITYLCDKHKNLLPQEGPARATALEWLMFCNATLHPAYSNLFGAAANSDETFKAKAMPMALEKVNKLWADVESRLGQSAYLAGDQVTAGDILLTTIGNWSAKFGDKITLGPKTKALFAKIIARPAYQKTLQTEQVEYKVAA